MVYNRNLRRIGVFLIGSRGVDVINSEANSMDFFTGAHLLVTVLRERDRPATVKFGALFCQWIAAAAPTTVLIINE